MLCEDKDKTYQATKNESTRDVEVRSRDADVSRYRSATVPQD
jgi:hypothetical protein